MPYKIRRTLEFRNQYLKLTRKNKSLQSKIDNKIKQIAANPTRIGKPKTGDMKYTYGSHVADHFVIVYMLILENIEIEFPELWSVMSADLKRHLKR